MDFSLPGFSVHGVLQQEYWGPYCHPPGNLPGPGIKPMSLMSPVLAGGLFTTGTTGEAPNTVYMTPRFLLLTSHMKKNIVFNTIHWFYHSPIY